MAYMSPRGATGRRILKDRNDEFWGAESARAIQSSLKECIPASTPASSLSSQKLWDSFESVISEEMLEAAPRQALPPSPSLKRKQGPVSLGKTNDGGRKLRKTEPAIASTKEATDSYVTIANCPSVQAFISKRCLSYGVQWEIARLVSVGRIAYENISIESLDKLKGSNAESASEVVSVLFADLVNKDPASSVFAAAVEDENKARTPWTELDMEVTARSACDTAALGCNTNSSWYGGKVHFIGKLKDNRPKKGEKPKFSIELERPTLGSSSRFSRRFGSHSFLRINIKKDTQNDEKISDDLTAYFRQPFILAGRVFRAFFSNERSVFMYMTNEFLEGGVIKSAGITTDGQMSIMDFLNWHNPLKANLHQSISKWAARFALGLSNSVPGFRLEPNCIEPLADEFSPVWSREGKLPSELDMTDGCGFANAPLLRRLKEAFEWENYPTAVQCRLGGAKGLLLLHPSGWSDDTQTEPKVWLRPSQIKIQYPTDEPLDEAMLTVDVLRCARMKSPSRLSAETIICLAENGVPCSVFKKLMQDGLDELVKSLTTWDGCNAMESLFYHIAKVGGVFGQRMGRKFAGESRLKGYGFTKDDDDDDDDDDDNNNNNNNNNNGGSGGENDDMDDLQIDPAIHERLTAWWEDQISGQPSSLHETCMVLLSAGFHPHSCPVLAAKLKAVLTTAIETVVKHHKISITLSCDAFIVPDPFGVLEEGEVHIKIKGLEMDLAGRDGLPIDVVQGDVLVMRHPCKVPSDIQKVKAVEHPALRQFTNVIVFPIKGKRSLASMLGGGDYDGDTVTAVWQPEIVNAFTNADISYADPPKDLKKSFFQNTESIEQLLQRAPPEKDLNAHLHEIQTFLLSGIKNQSIVGNYSVMHDNAVYQHGYFSEKAKRLAYMFCACLDGSKTGMVVDPAVYKKDRDEFKKTSGPEWKAKSGSPEGFYLVHTKRPKNLHKFVMDVIKDCAEKEKKKHMDAYDQALPANASASYDKDLVSAYIEAQKSAEVLEEKDFPGKMNELNLIVEHVKDMRRCHRKRMKKKVKNTHFTSLAIETRQDILRSLSRKFFSGPKNLLYFQSSEVERIRASYAYYHDWEEANGGSVSWTRFPWDVAMRELCAMKAKATGFEKTITPSFYENMTIVHNARKVPR